MEISYTQLVVTVPGSYRNAMLAPADGDRLGDRDGGRDQWRSGLHRLRHGGQRSEQHGRRSENGRARLLTRPPVRMTETIGPPAGLMGDGKLLAERFLGQHAVQKPL